MVTVGVSDGKNSSGGDETGTPGVDATIAVTIEVDRSAPSAGRAGGDRVGADAGERGRELGRADRPGRIELRSPNYDVRYFAGTADPDPSNEENWVTADEVHGLRDPGTDTTATILGLTANTAYRVQVRAIGDVDPTDGEWSASATVTTPAAVPSAESQLSNTQRSIHSAQGRIKSNDWATSFRTATTSTDGYEIENINLNLNFVPAASINNGHNVRAYVATGLPSTTTVVAELASPATLTKFNNVFTAPRRTILEAGTTYWLVVEATSVSALGTFDIALARSGNGAGLDPAPRSKPGWAIGNRSYSRGHASTGAFTEVTVHNTPLMFQVNAAPYSGPPVFVSLSVAGDELTFTFSKDLDATSKPATSAFPVTVNGTDRTVTGVEISGKQLILTLASRTFAGDTLTFAYDKL